MIKMSLKEKLQLEKFLKEMYVTSVLIFLYLFSQIRKNDMYILHKTGIIFHIT